MKKHFILAIVIVLLVGIASFTAASGEDALTVTRIQGDRITVRDSQGVEKTLSAGTPGLKVGDKAKVVGNKVCSWDWGNKAPQNVSPPTNSRQLPFDDGSRAPVVK